MRNIPKKTVRSGILALFFTIDFSESGWFGSYQKYEELALGIDAEYWDGWPRANSCFAVLTITFPKEGYLPRDRCFSFSSHPQ